MTGDARPTTAWEILGLVRRAKLGDERAYELLKVEYGGLVGYLIRDHYMSGAEREDLEQEAWVGFWEAIHDFKPSRGVPFASFVMLVVRRRIITASKAAGRGKHRVLTNAMRVAVSEDGEEITVADLLPTPYSVDPYDVVVRRERLLRLLAAVSHLSELERESLLDLVEGRSYAEIGARRGSGFKRIDNAVQRARRKLAVADAA